jgi:NAD(P)-dependent dehydrogenase (short-subunit alcohol dehydrogenase family)
MLELENKIALITGSDSGMGQAMAEEFAKAGANEAKGFRAKTRILPRGRFGKPTETARFSFFIMGKYSGGG